MVQEVLRDNSLGKGTMTFCARSFKKYVLYLSVYLGHESTFWRHYFYLLLLEIETSFRFVIQARRKSSRLQDKDSTLISQIF